MFQAERLTLARLISSDMFNCTAELATNLARTGANDDDILHMLHRVLTICDEDDDDDVIEVASGASGDKVRQAAILRDVAKALNAKLFGLLIRYVLFYLSIDSFIS